jgi:hypothetical protein
MKLGKENTIHRADPFISYFLTALMREALVIPALHNPECSNLLFLIGAIPGLKFS